MDLKIKKEDINQILKKYSSSDSKPKTVKNGLKHKSNKFKCSEKFFNKLEDSMRYERIKALSAPKPIRLLPWPNPKYERTLPAVIHKSTMKGIIPPRIIHLSKPKQRQTVNEIFQQKLEKSNRITPRKEVSYTRIEKLSKPKPKFRKIHDRCQLDNENREKKYFAPSRTAMKNLDDRIKHNQWLKINAKPKKIHERPIEFPFRKLSKDHVSDLIDRLSIVPEFKKFVKKIPIIRTEPRPAVKNIYPMNLDWVNRLSVPKKLPADTLLNIDYNPYFISKKVLKAKPSPRIIELSEPKTKVTVQENEELKENPFGVSPKALKYRATKRIKKLAQPRKR